MPILQPAATQITPPGSGPRIVATSDPGSSPPSITLQVAGVPASRDVAIVRLDPDGRSRPVRTAEPLPIGANGIGACTDYEMPHNSPVRYRISSLGLNSGPVSVESSDIWLIDPGTPGSSVRVPTLQLAAMTGRDYPVRGVVTEVQGRPDAIVTIMGNDVGAPTSSLTIHTETEREGWAMRDLVRTAGAVLLQVPRYSGQRPLWEYVYFTSRSEDFRDRGLTPALSWDLPFRVVARPGGSQNAVWDWESSEDTFSGWDELTLAYPGGYHDWTIDKRETIAP